MKRSAYQCSSRRRSKLFSNQAPTNQLPQQELCRTLTFAAPEVSMPLPIVFFTAICSSFCCVIGMTQNTTSSHWERPRSGIYFMVSFTMWKAEAFSWKRCTIATFLACSFLCAAVKNDEVSPAWLRITEQRRGGQCRGVNAAGCAGGTSGASHQHACHAVC